MPESRPPIVLKHEFLERLEELSRDKAKVASLRRRLECDAPVDELAESLVRNGVVDAKVARILVDTWAAPDGWLGPIMDEVRAKFLEAARLIEESGSYLSAFWVLGATDGFHVFVHPLDDRVLMLLCTPHLPEPLVLAKLKFDPGFDRLLRRYVEDLRAILIPD